MTHPFFDVPVPTVIGHRGCAGEAPENTLVSFERALAAGATILESDVHLTRDGIPVLIHDDVVDRNTDGAGRVCELRLNELQRLDAGHGFSADGGQTHPFRGRGHRIPTLEEALEAFPQARFNLELKERVPGLVERSVEVVARARHETRTLLTAGDDGLMAQLRAHAEAESVPVALGACAGEILAFVRAAIDGTAPKAGVMALQVPHEFGGQPLVTRPFVEHAHAHGLFVHVWTINKIGEMRQLLEIGVDGLVTDFPGRMRGLIEAHAPGSV